MLIYVKLIDPTILVVVMEVGRMVVGLTVVVVTVAWLFWGVAKVLRL